MYNAKFSHSALLFILYCRDVAMTSNIPSTNSPPCSSACHGGCQSFPVLHSVRECVRHVSDAVYVKRPILLSSIRADHHKITQLTETRNIVRIMYCLI
jgi:hypothetical protein